MSWKRMEICLAAFLIVVLSTSVGESQTCEGLRMPDQGAVDHTGGVYINTDTAISCAGEATKWNVCVDRDGFDENSGKAYVGVYRHSGSTYSLIRSQTITRSRPSSGTPYSCTTTVVSGPFIVQAGDIIGVCIPDDDHMGTIAFLNGGGSLWRSTSDCNSLSNSLNLGSYTRVNNRVMHVTLEIDECAVQNGGCEHVCTDTVLGRSCLCYAGYRLGADETSCTEINECSTNNGNCSHTCTNTDGSYMCSCNVGYELSTTDNRTCSLPSSTEVPPGSLQFSMVIIGVVVCSVLFGTILITAIAICCHRRNKKVQTAAIPFKCERSERSLQELQLRAVQMCGKVTNFHSVENQAVDTESKKAHCTHDDLIMTVPNEAYEILSREQRSHEENSTEDYI